MVQFVEVFPDEKIVVALIRQLSWDALPPTHPDRMTLTRSHAHWPRRFEEKLGAAAPSRLWAIGNPEILAEHKVGLFCSVRCPGDAILGAYDAVRKLRDDGVTVVSGFHSPVEKECLRILLRGKQPIVNSVPTLICALP